MTIQFLRAWKGFEQFQIDSSLGATEEARLVGLGLARTYAVGQDGRSLVSLTGVVSSAAPSNADGMPDGTIYIQTAA